MVKTGVKKISFWSEPRCRLYTGSVYVPTGLWKGQAKRKMLPNNKVNQEIQDTIGYISRDSNILVDELVSVEAGDEKRWSFHVYCNTGNFSVQWLTQSWGLSYNMITTSSFSVCHFIQIGRLTSHSNSRFSNLSSKVLFIGEQKCHWCCVVVWVSF